MSAEFSLVSQSEIPKSELPPPENVRHQLEQSVQRLIDKHKMPGISAGIFEEMFHYDDDSLPRKYTPEYEKRTLQPAAEHVVSTYIDRNRTGLELELALRHEFTNQFKKSILEYGNVAVGAGDDPVPVLNFVRQRLSNNDKVRFAAEIANLYTEAPGKPEASAVTDLALEYYIKSEEKQYAFFAGDLQKLKSCNDFGTLQIDGMDGQTYVDKFGFSELGKRYMALSVLLGSDQYSRVTAGLEGETKFDPLNGYEEVEVSEDYYKQEVLRVCDPTLLRYCQENNIRIMPSAKRAAGDEMTFLMIKGRNEDGSANEINDADTEIVKQLLEQVSHVDLGIYSDQDADSKRNRGKDIFEDRFNLPEGDLRIGFSIRLGSHRVDEILTQHITEVDEEDNKAIAADEAIDKYMNDRLDRYIGRANQSMEINKKNETMDILLKAINGDSDAQLIIVLLAEQSRFPGSIIELKESLKEFQGREITESEFKDKIESRLDRRNTERPQARYDANILIQRKGKYSKQAA